MNPAPTDETCPVSLDYPEPEPARLDFAAIIRAGRRLRRRRRLARSGTAVLACAALAGALVVARSGPTGGLPSAAGPAAGLGSAPIASLVAGHPPVGGKPALLSRWPPNWTTVAWATRQGDLCWATVRIPVQYGATEDECPGWTRADIPGPGRLGMSPLLPGVFPAEAGLTDSRPDGAGDRVAEVGLVTARAVRVTLTFFGHAFTARVIGVPMRGGAAVGVFMVWLTLPPGISGYGSAGITGEVAYDAAGHVIARHGPWS